MCARTQPSILYSQILHELGIILRDSRKEPLLPQPIVDLVDHVRRDLAEISPAACREGRSRAARSYLGSISADLGTISGDISQLHEEIWDDVEVEIKESLMEKYGHGSRQWRENTLKYWAQATPPRCTASSPLLRCDYLGYECFVCWHAGSAVAVAADAAQPARLVPCAAVTHGDHARKLLIHEMAPRGKSELLCMAVERGGLLTLAAAD